MNNTKGEQALLEFHFRRKSKGSIHKLSDIIAFECIEMWQLPFSQTIAYSFDETLKTVIVRIYNIIYFNLDLLQAITLRLQELQEGANNEQAE